MRAWVVRFGIASALLASATAGAQDFTFTGGLDTVLNVRGPFQTAVVGGSTVGATANQLGTTTAVLDLPQGSQAALAALFWWGSGEPDRDVNLTLPDGTSLAISALATDCFTLDVDLGQVARYYQCLAIVTDQLALEASLDGTYTFSGNTVNTGAPFFVNNGSCATNSQACSIYVGSFALALLYVDPANLQPRVTQWVNGLAFSQFIGNDVSLPLPAFEMSNNGGQATVVALEGDSEFPGNACNGTINDTTDGTGANTGQAQCDFFAFCRDTCISNLSILPLTQSDVLTTLTNANNPAGNIYNETVSTEFVGQVSGVDGDERNGVDIDTFNLAGRLPNGVYDDLVIGMQTGGDAVLLALVAVSIEDFDRDGDGLSNIQEEDDVGTNPDDPDTDGDGVFDGTEFFGGNPADPNSNPTDPLDPDSDNDGLCDGSQTIAPCVGGEDKNDDGIRDANETNPNDADSDDDALGDGVEVLTGSYGGPTDADPVRTGFQTSPLDGDSDDDGLLDGAEDVDHDGTFDPAGGETDPTNADTDGGGESDGSERDNGRDPVDFPIDDNGNLGNDDDGDGLANGQEDADNDGVVDPDETDPQNPDTDGDGLGDGVEVNGVNDTDPLNPDTDGDGILDGTEDSSHNGVTEPEELNPTDTDTDDDGLLDGTEDENFSGAQDPGETDGTDADSDDDGLCDGSGTVGACIGGEDVDDDGTQDAGETDPLDPDSDDDGVLDGTEVTSDFPGPVDADDTRDGSQTDPLNPDSDGDGLNDGVEDANADGELDGGETDPTNPADGPAEGEGEGEGEGEVDPDGNEGEPNLPEDVNDGDGDELEDLTISGSAAYSTCASTSTDTLGVFALVALAFARRRARRA